MPYSEIAIHILYGGNDRTRHPGLSYFGATTLLPGQDKLAPSAPLSGASWLVVSCGVRLSEVVLSEFRKPQVALCDHFCD